MSAENRNAINWPGVERVAVIGECMLELSAASPDTPAQRTLGYGGDTLNTAVYMAGAGLSVDYFTALGDDPHSDYMIEQWRSHNVGCEHLVRIPGRLPGLYMIDTDDAGERSFCYWREQSAARELFDQPVRAEAIFKLLNSYQLIYLSGVTLSLYSDDALERLLGFLRNFRTAGGLLAFDSNYRSRSWSSSARAVSIYSRFYSEVDVALPTLEDEQQLFGVNSSEQIASQLCNSGVSEFVIKEGGQGCLLPVGSELQRVSAEKVNCVVDTTGAGDSFNAGYLAGRIMGESAQSAAQRGHRLAAQVVQHRGAIVAVEFC